MSNRAHTGRYYGLPACCSKPWNFREKRTSRAMRVPVSSSVTSVSSWRRLIATPWTEVEVARPQSNAEEKQHKRTSKRGEQSIGTGTTHLCEMLLDLGTTQTHRVGLTTGRNRFQSSYASFVDCEKWRSADLSHFVRDLSLSNPWPLTS